jgi:hypothetical protein
MTHSVNRLTRDLRDESGMALLISVIVLLLMSALALNSLQHAGDEAVGSGSSRRKDATLYAAESGMAVLKNRLFDQFLSPTKKEVDFYLPDLVKDAYGNSIEVITGAPDFDNGGLPAQPAKIAPSDTSKAKAGVGYSINQGKPGTMRFRAVRADITAMDVTKGLVHLQTQYRVPEDPGGGSY